MDSEMQQTKMRVLKWLTEESYEPTERATPQASFCFDIKPFGLSFMVIQLKGRVDSICVGAKLGLSNVQMDSYRSMSEAKRQEFLWELHLALLMDNELSMSELGPNIPAEFKEATLQSRAIFYDALSKDRLMSAIQSVYKALLLVVSTLEKYSGSISPTNSRPSIYS